METKLYCVAALVVAVLAPSALADCKTTKGDPFFDFPVMCGKVFTVAYSSGIGNSLSCIINQVECDKHNASLATVHTTLVTEGEKPQKETCKLTYLGKGVIARYSVEGDFWLKEIITSYAGFYGGKLKISLIVCRDDEERPAMKSAVSNYDAEFIDELNILDKAAPDDSMTWHPNTCNPYDYIDIVES